MELFLYIRKYLSELEKVRVFREMKLSGLNPKKLSSNSGSKLQILKIKQKTLYYYYYYYYYYSYMQERAFLQHTAFFKFLIFCVMF